jgi:hypothetical protein
MQDEYWDWDSYFLMQHHQAPTRLLDWSDGALIALHFALRNKPQGNDSPTNETQCLYQDTTAARVYVLEPDRLKEQLETLPERKITKQNWKTYVEKHPVYKYDEEEWEDVYLPGDYENLRELPIPVMPLVLDLPHITRRVAAQRSRFLVFGTDPTWLSKEFKKSDAVVREIVIESSSAQKIRLELRDSGITESVIYPDLDGLGRELRQLWEDRK